jgi:hypothetical protein
MTSVSPVPSTAQTRHARASYLKEEEARRKSRVAEIEAAGKADVARIKATGKVLQDLAKLEPEQAEHLRWLTGWTTLVFFAD